MIKNRKEINKKYTWDLEKMFANNKEWQKVIDQALEKSEKILKMKGSIAQDSNTLLDALSLKSEIWQMIENVFVYSRMKRDEDNSNDEAQQMCGYSQMVISKIADKMSFFEPELLSNSWEKIEKFINSNKDLKIYEFLLKDLFKSKKHILSNEEESLLSQLNPVINGSSEVYNMLSNADMTFKDIIDKDNNRKPLSHGTFINFMENEDQSIRKQSYENMYDEYIALENTLATTYNQNVKKDVILSRIKKYNSSIEAFLDPDNVDISVYNNLIEEVHNALPSVYEYMDIRKKVLNLNQLHMYDIYTPIFKVEEKEFSFEKSVDLMLESLKPLGDEYLNGLRSGVKNRWIDVFENEGKTSGAYSFGSFDSMPYVLLNHTNTLKDVFTLVHEMGHSMHSFYTRKTQPYIYGGHSIFTAEVASTVNECLLMKHLLKNEKDENMYKYLLTTYIEAFRTTLFRQTMFAEFEKYTHEIVEREEELTALNLSQKYLELNKLYFGDNVIMDEYIKYEWSRIPHFYSSFYVYKYATGYSAANAISDKILNGNEKDRLNYIEFLKSGEKDYPIELLKIAGVDMGKPNTVRDGLKIFANLVEELKESIK